jgi:hypothetical protein
MWSFVKKIKAFVFKALGREGKPTGKPQKLTPKAQERLMRENSEQQAGRLKELTKSWADGKIALPEWQAASKQIIKNAFCQAYLLGIGGKTQLTKASYGSLGGMLKKQYKWLARLTDGMAKGEVSPAKAAARIQMYAHASKEAHERGLAVAWKGATEEKWIRTKSESCPDCVRLEGMGWQKVGTFPVPASGKTRCLSLCGCYRLYR